MYVSHSIILGAQEKNNVLQKHLKSNQYKGLTHKDKH